MVAKIISGKFIIGALNYNEHKVKEGKAELLRAFGYHKPEDQLNFYEKLGRLENLAALNHRTKTNCVHVSLNFDPSEKLDKERLAEIAQTYMQKIGFGQQPYLVYQHHDAGHSHVHIVTTNIQRDGNRIALHNIGRTLSEAARKEIEKEFNLVPAESKSKQQAYSLKPVLLEKAVYGKSETKRAISNIVREVIRSYKFTSLTEMNAVLRQFNVTADRGKEGSKMKETGGLRYSILDKSGDMIGVPIKASDIYGKPTLKTLEQKFEENESARKEFKEELKETLSDIIRELKGAGQEKLLQQLKQEGINAIFHQNAQGFIYGVTYIDNVNRCVFKGSDLGKEFSAKAVTEYLENSQAVSQQKHTQSKTLSKDKATAVAKNHDAKKDQIPVQRNDSSSAGGSYLPYELSRDKKKKKKKRRSL